MENKPKFQIPPFKGPSWATRLTERFFSVAKYAPHGLAILAGGAFFFLFGAGFYVQLNGRGVNGLGGQGQTCYPNDTCNRSLTCFEVHEKKMCEREIKPVIAVGAKSCFEYSSEDGELHVPCFDSNDECLRSFGRVMQTKATILKGCGFE